jgi:endonuclease/exonuclease/phosphatase (EEP) superfamily protein YafD
VSLLVVVLQVTWAAPRLRWWAHTQPAAAGSAVELVAANLLYDNGRIDEAASRILALDADVLVLTEYDQAAQTAFTRSGVASDYPHRVELPRPGAFGSAVYSRFPITRTDTVDLAGTPTIDVDLALPDGRVRLVAVHTLQPLAGLGTLRAQHRILAGLVQAAGGPTILAGDFNATIDHGPFRAVLEHGLRDTHLERGAGRTTTWPVGEAVPAFTQLDHILVSDTIAVLAAGDRTVPGSDHRAVTARLALAR